MDELAQRKLYADIYNYLILSPLKVWVAIKHSGEIICAHCTCMAGLRETCSHVAALLFTAEANFQFKQQTSSTSLPCAWLPPFQCGDPYIRVGENTVETILS